MPRSLRFAPPGLFLHLTQRGNYRQRIFFCDADRYRYLDLLDRHSAGCHVKIAGYCLMYNHIHLLASGEREGAISQFMKGVNGEFASYQHGRLARVGRFWQGRFYSSVLDESHLTTVLRYIERNPVRATLANKAEDYSWSSAGAHLGQCRYPAWLDEAAFRSRWTPEQWSVLLPEGHSRGELAAIRLAASRGRPLANDEFVRELEQQWGVTGLASPARKRPASHQIFPPEARLLAGA